MLRLPSFVADPASSARHASRPAETATRSRPPAGERGAQPTYKVGAPLKEADCTGHVRGVARLACARRKESRHGVTTLQRTLQ